MEQKIALNRILFLMIEGLRLTGLKVLICIWWKSIIIPLEP